jgi:hypothetical protein
VFVLGLTGYTVIVVLDAFDVVFGPVDDEVVFDVIVLLEVVMLLLAVIVVLLAVSFVA